MQRVIITAALKKYSEKVGEHVKVRRQLRASGKMQEYQQSIQQFLSI